MCRSKQGKYAAKEGMCKQNDKEFNLFWYQTEIGCGC